MASNYIYTERPDAQILYFDTNLFLSHLFTFTYDKLFTFYLSKTSILTSASDQSFAQ